jgi:succinylglutamic semialdehyde dehydrogenase
MSGYGLSTHPSLANPPCDVIGGRVTALTGDAIRSTNPARPSETVWLGSPRIEHVDHAIKEAKRAMKSWSRTAREDRFAALRRFARIANDRKAQLASLIRDETGKPQWDAEGEAGVIGAKVDITLDSTEHGALRRVTDYAVRLSDSRTGACRFRPHGVMAVVGPYNFPAHLPNGHIIPALAMGNTIVFKPSDKAPACGQMLVEMLLEAEFPEGVINMVHGGADIATKLVSHPEVDGVLFTGSWPVGRKILEANLDQPHKIVALEMGGNNAAIVMPDCDLKQAVIECVRSAFVTTGQRCTCTRRIIVHKEIADRFIAAFCKAASNLLIGDPRGIGLDGSREQVFMGPLISEEARKHVGEFSQRIVNAGGRALVQPTLIDDPSGGHYISPGVVLVDRFTLGEDATRDAGCDLEVFGPIVRILVTGTLDDAIEQANATKYGLAASIFTKDEEAVERFLFEAKAGCVNVNTGTAGASSKLPFGGLDHSGNHRPAGSFSLDYCAVPIASMIERGEVATTHPGMRFEDEWSR